MSGLRLAVGAFVLLVALAGCGGSEQSGEGGKLVIVSDVDNPPPEDEGFLEGIVRLELYVVDLDGGKPVRLTENATIELGPACSPDGTRIAFTGGEQLAQVEVMNVDGTARRRVTSGFHPAWSPDGEQLVFARDTKAGTALFVASADGRDERLLVDAPGNDMWPAWSPTGDRIAFLRGRPIPTIRTRSSMSSARRGATCASSCGTWTAAACRGRPTGGSSRSPAP